MYCCQPLGFSDPSFYDCMCLLQKSSYNLKQVPQTWFQRFSSFLHTIDFLPSHSHSVLIVLKSTYHVASLLLYDDDIVLTASSHSFLHHIINSLHKEFSMTDLGPFCHFFGIVVTRSSSGLFLSQQKYTIDLLSKAGMLDCHPSRTPRRNWLQAFF